MPDKETREWLWYLKNIRGTNGPERKSMPNHSTEVLRKYD